MSPGGGGACEAEGGTVSPPGGWGWGGWGWGGGVTGKVNVTCEAGPKPSAVADEATPQCWSLRSPSPGNNSKQRQAVVQREALQTPSKPHMYLPGSEHKPHMREPSP